MIEIVYHDPEIFNAFHGGFSCRPFARDIRIGHLMLQFAGSWRRSRISGTVGSDTDRRSILVAALFFMIGTVGAFAVLGAVSGFIGQIAGASLGLYLEAFRRVHLGPVWAGHIGPPPLQFSETRINREPLADQVVREPRFTVLQSEAAQPLVPCVAIRSAGSGRGDDFAGARPLGRSHTDGFLDRLQLADGRSPRWSGPWDSEG